MLHSIELKIGLSKYLEFSLTRLKVVIVWAVEKNICMDKVHKKTARMIRLLLEAHLMLTRENLPRVNNGIKVSLASLIV
jgi:hypothetical protein